MDQASGKNERRFVMIKFENPNGYIEITNNYFEKLVGQVAQSCFGVTGMVNSSPMQSLKAIISSKADKENYNRGVSVKSINGGLVIDLHIAVLYVENIAVVVKSIVNKVRYTVEQATNLQVAKVNVFVDAMKAEGN